MVLMSQTSWSVIYKRLLICVMRSRLHYSRLLCMHTYYNSIVNTSQLHSLLNLISLHIQVITLCMWRSNYRLAWGFKRTYPLGRRKQSTTSLCSHTQAHTGTHTHPMHTQAHTGTLTPYAHTGTPTPYAHTGTHTHSYSHTTHQRASYCQSLQKNMYKTR